MHKDEFKGGKVLLQLSGKCERNKVDEGSEKRNYVWWGSGIGIGRMMIEE